jgi:hypothetical protein
VETFADITGLNAREVLRAVRALSPTYVTTQDIESHRPMIMGVSDVARQAVGQWPSPESVTDRIVRELLEAAEREPDEAKRSRLRAAGEALGGFGRDLLVNVIANVATKPIGF